MMDAELKRDELLKACDEVLNGAPEPSETLGYIRAQCAIARALKSLLTAQQQAPAILPARSKLINLLHCGELHDIGIPEDDAGRIADVILAAFPGLAPQPEAAAGPQQAPVGRDEIARWYFDEHYGYSLSDSFRTSAFGSGQHKDADRISFEMADAILSLLSRAPQGQTAPLDMIEADAILSAASPPPAPLTEEERRRVRYICQAFDAGVAAWGNEEDFMKMLKASERDAYRFARIIDRLATPTPTRAQEDE